ncbi:MAG TPA: hypothetical protein VGN69_08200 [Solirubrobacteraceae bacterium]|nr:hypothetical protein [Solirubrobacteraceae bacterium]
MRVAGATLVLFAALVVLVSVAAAAPPGGPPTPPPPDTEFTPTAKPSGLWSQAAGEVFPGVESPGYKQADSPTPFGVNFYSVSFLNPANGFAGGAECAAASDPIDKCVRQPSIYGYLAKPGLPGVWKPTLKADGPGFVGAIAWIGPGRALAVGGSGSYPSRDQLIDPAHPDSAGAGRAWLYDHGSWCELKSGAACGALPPGVGGLTALDCTPRPNVDGEFCVAGGYRQLWMWKNGRFQANAYTDGSPAGDLDKASDFLYRVRAIRFVPGRNPPPPVTSSGQPDPNNTGGSGDVPGTQVVALTSGCCAGTGETRGSRALVYDGRQWYVRQLFSDGGQQGVADSFYAAAMGDVTFSVLVSPGGPEPGSSSIPEAPSQVVGGLAVPQSPQPQPDTTAAFNSAALAEQQAGGQISSVRMNAGDGIAPRGGLAWAVGVLRSSGQGAAYTTTQRSDVGDVSNPNATTPLNPLYATCPPEVINGSIAGVFDLTLARNPAAAPGDLAGALSATQCRPADYQSEAKSQALVLLPSYALNAFALTGSATVGWAVGDRGAIMRLGGGATAGAAGAEPASPALGTPGGSSDPAATPYDLFRPAPPSGELGLVPSLAARPPEHLAQAQLVASATPNSTDGSSRAAQDIRPIVMSRDGSEGWAISPGNGNGGWTQSGDGGTSLVMGLFHYQGSTWKQCDPEGVDGLVAPDPACASLAPLLHYRASGQDHPVQLFALARVPLESGGDPTHANDFEAIAVGSEYTPGRQQPSHPVVIRYRQGRWALDEPAMTQIDPDELLGGATGAGTRLFLSDVAFRAPEDGWMLARPPTATKGSGQSPEQLLHFDGRRWQDCSKGGQGCGGLPSGVTPASLTTAGERVYIAGHRIVASGGSLGNTSYPAIFYRDGGGTWKAAYDPGAGSAPDTSRQGQIKVLSVVRDSQGRYSGWATGYFGPNAALHRVVALTAGGGDAAMLRLAPDGTAGPWSHGDAVDDYLFSSSTLTTDTSVPSLVALADGSALVDPGQTRINPLGPPLRFDVARQRWVVLNAPFAGVDTSTTHAGLVGLVRSLAPDGRGGAWLVMRHGGLQNQVQNAATFYRYTDRPPQPVFADVANPVRREITAAAAAADGSLWVATNSGTVHRHDRLTGWETLTVSGWDPGHVVTSASPAYAVAVGPDGRGVVVGKGGRIADIAPGVGGLDPAAGLSCGGQTVLPCATTRDLHSAAVAPDGSAMVGGDKLALAWRRAGGSFHAVDRPPASPGATITGVSLPSPERAWVTTNSGELYAGTLSGDTWSWRIEDVTENGDLLTLAADGRTLALHGVAVDAAGHGFAVGDQGVILERAGSGPTPWRRVATGFRENLWSVALPVGRGRGALIGGTDGLVLTLVDGHFELANQDDPYLGPYTGGSSTVPARMVGVALTPGVGANQVEAWAVSQADRTTYRQPPPSTVLHYASDPAEALLSLGGGLRPLPDSPAPRPGEMEFAAFGKSECRVQIQGTGCGESSDSNMLNELVARRVSQELAQRAQGPSGPAFALWTGDVNDKASGDTPAHSFDHRRFVEAVAHRLQDAGLPFYGALGGQDVVPGAQAGTGIGVAGCSSSCGPSLAWRQAFAEMAAPWGAPSAKPSPGSRGLTFTPAPGTGVQEAPGGGAHTHYAFDVKRGDTAVARVVMLDSSLKTVSGADSAQNPVESQLAWLRSTLCVSGQDQSPADHCSRAANEQAVVVSETPSYSYGPGSTTDTLTDGTTLETLLVQYHANLVVSGRLGWNALYWTTAPGLHSPCAGDPYPDPRDSAPQATSTPKCGPTSTATPTAPDAANQLAGSLASTAAPAAPAGCAGTGPNTTGVLPNVVAASAGGKFGPDGQSSGSADTQGYWHGYTIMRLDTSGDPRCMIVEQRPVFDWLGISAATHVLRPGQHVTLRGYGREPVGIDQPIQFDDINGPAITHRYDLLKADPQHPYLPATTCAKTATNPAGYCELDDSSIGRIDPIAGTVTTGRGNHPRVYAIGLLSTGDKAASWPLIFEPRRNYLPAAPVVTSIPATPALPQIHVAAIAATNPPPPPSSPPPAPPSVGTPTLPQLPGLPGLPPLNTPPPAALPPPAGAAPPAPPASQAPSALSISVSPQSVGFAPPSGVVPPPAPPINPAPPGGAKREAKAKQPAAAKSEESGAGEASETQQGGGDMVDGRNIAPGTSQMARRDRVKPAPSFTLLVRSSHPSAWSQGAVYGGALALMAAILALAYSTVRPTPRRRTPSVPAPSYVRRQRER